MGRVVSIHEYELKPGINVEQFEQVLRDAKARGLLQLPGLVAHYLVKGTKGVRRGAYAAVWIYESREAWEHLLLPDPPRLRIVLREPRMLRTIRRRGGSGSKSFSLRS